jgi:hypothetical protein
MAALTSKEGLYQEEQIIARKKGRCHLIKEKEAKNKNSLCGGAAKIATQAIPPQRGGMVSKIGRFWLSHQFPHVAEVPEGANRPPKYANRLSSGRQGSHVTSGVRGERTRFHAYSSINGYNKKPFSQIRSGKPSSTAMSKSAYLFSNGCEK